MCVHTTFELFDRDSRDVHHAPQQFGDLSFTHVVSAGSLDLRGRYGRPVRWPLADLERPGHRAERDRETVPAVDGHDRQREIDELSLAELLSSQLVHLVGDVFDADARDRFGPGERRALALGEERRLAPQANGVQPLFRFAERSRDLGVHVGAIRAAVDERGPQLDQLEERSLESALVYILFETPHRGPDARGRLRVIDPWLHRCLLSFFGREDRAPESGGSPDTRAQTLKLHNLAVVHKQIYFGTTRQQHLARPGSRSGHRSIHSTNDPTLSVTTITRRTRSFLYISVAPARASSTDG